MILKKLESNYDIYAEYAPEATYALRNEMDWKFLAEVTNAFYTVGKLDIEWSGVNTSGITPYNIIGNKNVIILQKLN